MERGKPDQVLIFLNANTAWMVNRGPYGVNPVQRLVRQFRGMGYENIHVVADDAGGWSSGQCDGLSIQHLQDIQLISEWNIIVEGDTIADGRLLAFLDNKPMAVRFIQPQQEAPLLARVTQTQMKDAMASCARVGDLLHKIRGMADVRSVDLSEVDSYLLALGQHFAPFLYRFNPGVKDLIYEGVLFERLTKPVSNFLWQFLFKYPVRDYIRVVRWLPWARPALFSLIGLISTLASPIFWFVGDEGWALALAWLALFTVEFGDKYALLVEQEHRFIRAITTFASWFWPYGWGLLFGAMLSRERPEAFELTAVWVLAMAVSDMSEWLIKRRQGKHPDDWSLSDRIFSLLAADEAILILCLTLEFKFDTPELGFLTGVGWAAATAVWRIAQVLRFGLQTRNVRMA